VSRGTKISETITSYTIEEYSEIQYEMYIELITKPLFSGEVHNPNLTRAYKLLRHSIIFGAACIKHKHC
jgi:hypothetical protein